MPPEGAKSRLAAIMFTDIVGYTAHLGNVVSAGGSPHGDARIRWLP